MVQASIQLSDICGRRRLRCRLQCFRLSHLPLSLTRGHSRLPSAKKQCGHAALAERKAKVKTFRLGDTMGSEATEAALSHRAWRSWPGLTTMTSGLGRLRRRRTAAEYHRPLSIGLIRIRGEEKVSVSNIRERAINTSNRACGKRSESNRMSCAHLPKGVSTKSLTKDADL